MSPYPTLETVKNTLTNALTLDQIWLDHAPLWQQLGWSVPQVKLWLACLPNIRSCTTPAGEPAYQLEWAKNQPAVSLADEMVALLEKSGRPLPLAQLLGKLPVGIVVTETMLRTAAMKDARLELKGPLLKLA